MFDFDLEDLPEEESSPPESPTPACAPVSKSAFVKRAKAEAKNGSKPQTKASAKVKLEDLAAAEAQREAEHMAWLQRMSQAQPTGPPPAPKSATRSNIDVLAAAGAGKARMQAESVQHLAAAAPAPKARTKAPVAPFLREGPPPDHWYLPARGFVVAHKRVMVREKPHMKAKVVAAKNTDDFVEGVEETFDGWVRLVGEAGWILKDMRDPEGGGYFERGGYLEAVDSERKMAVLLVALEPAEEPGQQLLEVLASTGVEVRREPLPNAEVLGVRNCGEMVLAETQTYNGWVRLADNAGWILGKSFAHGQILSCKYEQEQAQTRVLGYRERAREEKAAKEAAAEAALAREACDGERSQWWSKLQDADSRPAATIDAVGNLPVNSLEHHVVTLAEKQGIMVGWNRFELPTQEFRVVHTEGISLHMAPDIAAMVCGRKGKGDEVIGIEETFNGWVKLADQAGWVPRDMRGKHGIGVILRRVGKPATLAVDEVYDGPGRRMFEVVHESPVHFRKEPRADAEITGVRRFGEFVLAETQTYHGWIRLADGAGWLQSSSPELGVLIRSVTTEEHLALPAPPPVAAEEGAGVAKEAAAEDETEKQLLRQEALAHLEGAAASGDAASFRSALQAAKKNGVPKRDIAKINAMFSVK